MTATRGTMPDPPEIMTRAGYLGERGSDISFIHKANLSIKNLGTDYGLAARNARRRDEKRRRQSEKEVLASEGVQKRKTATPYWLSRL
jgi:hypothetical protein